jgi:hypothetical protein
MDNVFFRVKEKYHYQQEKKQEPNPASKALS